MGMSFTAWAALPATDLQFECVNAALGGACTVDVNHLGLWPSHHFAVNWRLASASNVPLQRGAFAGVDVATPVKGLRGGSAHELAKAMKGPHLTPSGVTCALYIKSSAGGRL